MKHSYIRYAAFDPEGFILQVNGCEVDGKYEKWFDAWAYDPEIIDECSYTLKDCLEADLKGLNQSAQIKKFKITVEQLDD